MKIIFVVAARPNFPKIAPLIRACNVLDADLQLVHTGQHYDFVMSDSFFRILGIPAPDINFEIGGGSHAENTAKTMIAFEKYLREQMPDLVVVVGDVDATMSCGIVSKKCNIPLAHVEAGLRSFDESMPEEINRIIVDRIADYLFVHEESGLKNLKSEGVPDKKVFFIGNVMIDSLVHALPKVKESSIRNTLGINRSYALVTMHRPATVDVKSKLSAFIEFLKYVSKTMLVVWPLHPRTKKNLEMFNLYESLCDMTNIMLTESLEYTDFMNLVINADVVFTDSGGIQEETSYLNVPCLTFRENTERPITVLLGSNELVGYDYERAKIAFNQVLKGEYKLAKEIPLWDGRAAERFAKIVLNNFKIGGDDE